MDIVQTAKERNRGLVTQSGQQVTVLKRDCRGKYPLVGIIHEQDYDRGAMWSAAGTSNTVLVNDALTEYSVEKHFKWGMLPGWANLCIFKGLTKWRYSSVLPEWDPDLDQWAVKNPQAVHGEIPESVAATILWKPERKDSLVMNPKYD